MTRDDRDDTVHARMPADVDAADKVLYGLTFRQLAILAVAAVIGYSAWQALHTLVPVPVLVGAAVVLGGLVFGLAVGRRDGLAMDVWLLAAVRHSRRPRALSTTDTTAKVPDWVQAPASTVLLPAPLKLPADAVDEHGEIHLGGGSRAAMVAATSVNLALRTAEEQAALIDTFGRWLNSLSTPTQIVVSAQPVDLRSAARTLAAAVDLPHPARADAGADHAAFLHDLAERRDPLRRQVLIVTRTCAGERGEHAARRRADDTARSLSGLGVTTRALDGHAATEALAAAADPYRAPRPGGLAAPDTVITGPSRATPRKPTS